ncbi:hypothetical protein PV04_07868 [Phialophora macrospora]|uniref:Uncharacterized protein n=1 Tax=Phialophora macrospora TaxID=1851006 RepID=A0A0D2CK27_9EURO|nr:hypothetical protein PV04_07868 [Phialophora macrospora]
MPILLAMALADGAQFGYDTLDDVRQQVILDGKNELILQFKDSAFNQPILQKYTEAGGVNHEPMITAAFLDISRSSHQRRLHLWRVDLPAIERQPPQSLDSMAIAVAEGRSSHPLKRYRPSLNPPIICPTVILIDDDSTSDDRARANAASTVFPPQGSHADDDDGMFPDLKCSPSLADHSSQTLRETTN